MVFIKNNPVIEGCDFQYESRKKERKEKKEKKKEKIRMPLVKRMIQICQLNKRKS